MVGLDDPSDGTARRTAVRSDRPGGPPRRYGGRTASSRCRNGASGVSVVPLRHAGVEHVTWLGAGRHPRLIPLLTETTTTGGYVLRGYDRVAALLQDAGVPPPRGASGDQRSRQLCPRCGARSGCPGGRGAERGRRPARAGPGTRCGATRAAPGRRGLRHRPHRSAARAAPPSPDRGIHTRRDHCDSPGSALTIRPSRPATAGPPRRGPTGHRSGRLRPARPITPGAPRAGRRRRPGPRGPRWRRWRWVGIEGGPNGLWLSRAVTAPGACLLSGHLESSLIRRRDP